MGTYELTVRPSPRRAEATRKKQAKKNKKAKAKSKRARATGGGKERGDGGDGGAAAALGPLAVVAERSLESVTAATGRLAVGDGEEEEAEGKSEEDIHADAKPAAPATALPGTTAVLLHLLILGPQALEQRGGGGRRGGFPKLSPRRRPVGLPLPHGHLLDDGPYHRHGRPHLPTCRAGEVDRDVPGQAAAPHLAHDEGAHVVNDFPRPLCQIAGAGVHRAAAPGVGGEEGEEEGREVKGGAKEGQRVGRGN